MKRCHCQSNGTLLNTQRPSVMPVTHIHPIKMGRIFFRLFFFFLLIHDLFLSVNTESTVS